MIDALRKREEMMSTAMKTAWRFAPRRPMPYNIGDSFLILGVCWRRTVRRRVQLTDLFLIGALDDKTHLRTLAGIGKILKHPEFLPRLRELETPEEILDWIKKIEKET